MNDIEKMASKIAAGMLSGEEIRYLGQKNVANMAVDIAYHIRDRVTAQEAVRAERLEQEEEERDEAFRRNIKKFTQTNKNTWSDNDQKEQL